MDETLYNDRLHELDLRHDELLEQLELLARQIDAALVAAGAAVVPSPSGATR
jgi:hypothetical protein